MGEGLVSPVVTVTDLSRRFGDTTALDRISFSLRENAIYGLLGRNGAGKTTLMRILAGHDFATSGKARVLGADPFENETVLSRLCFVKESQRYPDAFRVLHVLRAASLLFPDWDEEFAGSLVEAFQLRTRPAVKKLSRGMLSALGIVVGLASRAPLTFFDEPYLGLDPVARRIFYDRLLADYAEHPRTVVLSTHLIDEVSDLIEHVLLIDRGRLLLDEEAEALRGQVTTVTGPVAAVDQIIAARDELHRERLGSVARATVRGEFGSSERTHARSLGLSFEPVSLQQLTVHLTTRGSNNAAVSEEPLR
jgi:ABC-2 type transport system ATP-binding protein